MKTISKALIFIISISFLHAQDLTQNFSLPMQGKSLDFNPGTGIATGVSNLPIPNLADYPGYVQSGHIHDKLYRGEVPLFDQQIVKDNNGNLLFFIIDNVLYNKDGISSFNPVDVIDELNSSTILSFQKDTTKSNSDNIISNLHVIPMDNLCYQYTILWIEESLSSNSGASLKARVITLNNEGYFDANAFEQYYEVKLFENGGADSDWNSDYGFEVGEVDYTNGIRYVFAHMQQEVLIYKLDNNILSISENNAYSNIYPLHSYSPFSAISASYVAIDETELYEYEVNGENYYNFAYSYVFQNNYAIAFVKFDSQGNLIHSVLKQFDHWSNYHYVKGLEFSPDGQTLYYTRAGIGLEYLNMDFLFNNTNPSNSTLLTQLSSGYDLSHIELGRDGRMYLINASNGTLTSFSNPNTPSNIQVYENVANITGLTYSHNYITNNSTNQYSARSYRLSKQLDGEDYANYYESFFRTSCCEDHFTYNVETEFTVAQGTTATWTPSSNPFTTGGGSVVYFRENLILPQNTNITLTGLTLKFREGKGIILSSGTGTNKGAKLTLDNTKCTAYDGCGYNEILWAGITLNGSGASPQLPLTNTQQPQLHMLNNAEIEFANTGVLSDNGGVVIADQSKFTDNRFAVRLRYYNQENESKFHSCTFRSTNNLYDVNNKNTYVYQLVNLYTVKGIDFLGCAFVNNNTINSNPTMKWKNGWGINAYLSSFTVDKKVINNGYTPCSFNNLADAIHSNNGTAISVRHSVFNNDKSGVWVIGTDGPVMIANNEFYTDAAVLGNYGVYIDACNGFEVTENTFYSGDAGIVVKNTQSISGGVYQSDQNRVYKNIFYNLRNTGHNAAACLAHGENSDYLVDGDQSTFTFTHGEAGLDYECNHYFGNDHNIAVRGTATVHANIDQSQCSASKPTGNIFYNRTLTNWDFYAQYTDVEQYQYHHYNLPNHDLQRNYDPNIVLNDPTVLRNQCLSIFGGNGTIDIDFDVDVVLSSVESKKSDAANLKNEVQTLKDGGQTEYLLDKVQNLTQQNYMSTSVDLLEASPYLSSEVLKAFMQNPINRPVVKTLVLAQNSPLPTSLKSEIEYLNVPKVFKWYLAQLQSGVNVLEEKQQLMDDLLADADILLDRAILFSVVAGNTDKMDSLIVYLESKANLYADQKLMPLYEAKNDFLAVDNKLLDLDAYKNELTGDQAERLEDYILIKGIENAIQKNPSNGNNIIKAKSDLLRVVAAKTTKEGNMAAALLTSAGYAEYTPVYLLPDNNRSAAIDKPIKEYPSSAKESSIYIYPNPVNDVLHVEYFSLKEQGTLEIFDLKGALVGTQTYGNALGYLDIPTSHLPKGTYILTLDGQSSQSVKFVVTH